MKPARTKSEEDFFRILNEPTNTSSSTSANTKNNNNNNNNSQKTKESEDEVMATSPDGWDDNNEVKFSLFYL